MQMVLPDYFETNCCVSLTCMCTILLRKVIRLLVQMTYSSLWFYFGLVVSAFAINSKWHANNLSSLLLSVICSCAYSPTNSSVNNLSANNKSVCVLCHSQGHEDKSAVSRCHSESSGLQSNGRWAQRIQVWQQLALSHFWHWKVFWLIFLF